VVPYIGDHPLAVLGPLHIERLYSELSESGRRRPSKKAGAGQAGLSPRTILHVHRVLSQCLKDAKRLRVIPDNPAVDVKRRRIRKGKATSAAELHVLPLDRMLALFDRIRAANLKSVPHALAVLAFDSGARRGELLALRWSDVDLDGCTLRIDRTVDETKAHGVTIKPEPKNESSRRTITLSAETITTLRAWRTRQLEDRLKLGAHLPADALIFPVSIETPTEPIRPRNVTKAFSWLVAREGFAGFRFHDFRHSCASHMLAGGVPVTEVARHLGHSSAQVTMTVYAHAIPTGDGGMGLLDRLMGAAEG
ncbi:MAG: site-specific integrase, partial [Alphaproteobacteria bacterium]|nr:site-specific integrase [Alphaproteobacteria bacterium]